MSKLYKLTKETHKLVKKLAEQEKIEIKLNWGKGLFSTDTMQAIGSIEAPQIRQILKAFEGVLGENPIVKENKEFIKKYERSSDWVTQMHITYCQKENETLNKGCPTLSQALCQKWLDGLDPMIDSDPEKVLEELNQILKSKIN